MYLSRLTNLDLIWDCIKATKLKQLIIPIDTSSTMK